MVPPLHRKKYTAEPEMSTGEEETSRTEELKRLCEQFLKPLRNLPWFAEYQKHMRDFKNNNIDVACLVEKMEELFQGRPELIAGFNQFLPKTYQIAIPPPTPLPKVRIVFQKRKRNDEGANSTESTDSDEGDNIRVLSNKKAKRDEPESMDSKLEKVIAFVNKVDERFRNKDDDSNDDDEACESYLEFFLDVLCKRNKSSPKRSIIADEQEEEKRELGIYKEVVTLLEGHKDLIKEFTHFLTKVPGVESFVDFENCKKCTPSYYLLPKNVPVPGATGRSELASQVLNDRWRCVNGTSKKQETSEDTSDPSTSTSSTRRSISRKSQHQEDLFLWEDEKYEHDMSREQVKSTSNNIERLLKTIETESPAEIYIEEHLSEMNLGCIEKMYGLERSKMMDLLMKNNIRRVLRVILERLKQKQEQLEATSSDLKRKWARLFAKERRRR